MLKINFKIGSLCVALSLMLGVQVKAQDCQSNLKKHVYFIAETKGSSLSSHLRKVEEAKIKCARKLFADIGNDSIGYDVVASFEQLLEKLE